MAQSWTWRFSTWAGLARTTTLIAGGCLLAATTAFAAPPKSVHKIDRAVRDGIDAGATTQPVIITVKPGYRDTIRTALKQHGDAIRSEHPLVEGVAVTLHSSDVEELAAQDWVESITLDSPVSATAVGEGHTPGALLNHPSETFSNALRETLGLPRIATSGSGTMTGATGVSVAIIDSGIAPNDDFGGRITGFYDFTRGGIPTTPYDDYGHGTHVAGLIGSSGKLSNYEHQGIAPDVHLIGLKVLDSTGAGRTSDVIKAIEYVVANKDRLNVQIINLSLGHPIYAPAKYDPLVQAVEKATAAGLIVVTSAGNFGQQKDGAAGYTGVTSPGNAPSAITVGAVATQDTVSRDDDSVALYSSRGPTWFDALVKPNVVAPGHNLASDTNTSSYLYKLLKNSHISSNGQHLLSLSGSSMAAAVTSGVVALILQQHNQSGYHKQLPLTANLVKAILEFTAIPVAGADYLTQGAGEINAAGAIALTAAINTGIASGNWWLASGVAPSTTIDGRSYAWSQTVIWTDAALTGHLVFESNSAWTSNVAWGSSDDNIVWGTFASARASNIVWGADQVWGANIVWADRVIGEMADNNIVWGTSTDDNIVWGTLAQNNIVWGTFQDNNIVWGTFQDDNNIVWGTFAGRAQGK
jgi:serine protease AprX